MGMTTAYGTLEAEVRNRPEAMGWTPSPRKGAKLEFPHNQL